MLCRLSKLITSPNRENLGEILNVFRIKYVKPQSMATAKHKFQPLVFNSANQKLIDFLVQLQKLAKGAFGVAAQAIIEQFIYAKMPPHLKKSIKQAHLENGTYEQIVSHLERELELKGLEAPDEMPINTVTPQAHSKTLKSPNQRATIAKNQVTIKISAVNSNEKKTKPEVIRTVPTKTMVELKQTLTPTKKFQTIPKQTMDIIKGTEDLEPSSHPVRYVVEPTTPQRNATLEQTQQIDSLPGIDDQKVKTKSSKEMHKATQMGKSKLQPKI